MQGPQTYRPANNARTDDSHIDNELKNTSHPAFDVKKFRFLCKILVDVSQNGELCNYQYTLLPLIRVTI
jgi:hypothetical protein